MAKEIQAAIVEVLIKKTIKAAKDYNAKAIILGGGVTANKELRKQLTEKIKKEIPKVKYLIPEPKYSTDNAAMTGLTAYFSWLKKKKTWKKIEANANLRID
jgi:N6-L-threonylcarbamoyladenine synthase